MVRYFVSAISFQAFWYNSLVDDQVVCFTGYLKTKAMLVPYVVLELSCQVIVHNREPELHEGDHRVFPWSSHFCIVDEINAYERSELSLLLFHEALERLLALDRVGNVGHSDEVDIESTWVLEFVVQAFSSLFCILDCLMLFFR